MNENQKKDLNDIKEMLECGIFTKEEILNNPDITIEQKRQLGLLKNSDSKTNSETTELINNETEYTIEELSDEAWNIVDKVLKDNPILENILKHSYNIAQAYTVLNFDNAVKREYIDKTIGEYNNLADCFYSVSNINEDFAYDIIKALIVAISENDWCFMADFYNGNIDFFTAQHYLGDKAKISLDRKAFWKENENKRENT